MTLPPNFGIYIATYKGDFKYSLGTIQSIRDSIGDLPITLLVDGEVTIPSYLKKDKKLGFIFTREISAPYDRKLFTGWGYAKIFPFIEGPYDSFLVLDADTVVIGNILKHINLTYDFYSSAYKPGYAYTDEDISNAFFKIEVMERIAGKDWRDFLSHFFLSGVFYSHKGLISYDEFVDAYREDEKNGNFLFPGDQGLLNFIIMRKDYRQMKIGASFFHFLSSFYHDDPHLASQFEKSLNSYRNPSQTDHPLVVHWGGNTKPYILNYFYRPRVMTYFRLKYLRNLGMAGVRSLWVIAEQDFVDSLKLLYYLVKVKMLKIK